MGKQERQGLGKAVVVAKSKIEEKKTEIECVKGMLSDVA